MNNTMEEAMEFSRDWVLSLSRDKRPVSARVVFAIACKKYGSSISEISRFLKRDHTTVMYYFKSATPDEMDMGSGFIFTKNGEVNPSIDVSGSIFPLSDAYRKVYETYNYKCAIPGCGRDDVLEIHHILGRKIDNSNAISNLSVLCPTHHALADRGMIFVKSR